MGFSRILTALPILAILIDPSSPFPTLVKPAVITSFKNGTWPEAIVARANGDLLVTRFTNQPALYAVDPFAPTSSNQRVVASFPQFNNKRGAAGLTEIEPDVFITALVGSRYDATVGRNVFDQTPTEFFTLDFNRGTSRPAVERVAVIKGAGFINGLAAVPGTSYVLGADSIKGRIYRLDTLTGEYSIVLSEASLQPSKGAEFPIGVNGIQVDKKARYVYFDNSVKKFLARFPIDHKGSPIGSVEIITKLDGFSDDFILDGNVAYLATNPSNSVLRISLEDGKVTTIAGGQNSTDVPGGTAVAFGRTTRDRRTLYVSCTGGLAGPINGTYTEPASVRGLHV